MRLVHLFCRRGVIIKKIGVLSMKHMTSEKIIIFSNFSIFWLSLSSQNISNIISGWFETLLRHPKEIQKITRNVEKIIFLKEWEGCLKKAPVNRLRSKTWHTLSSTELCKYDVLLL